MSPSLANARLLEISDFCGIDLLDWSLLADADTRRRGLTDDEALND